MLQLLYAPTSPFVRKVMVCAHLTNQAQDIQWLDSAANPIRKDPRIAAHSPLAKVPVLILPSGQALYDSRVICEYLATRAHSPHLFPQGDKRWTALCLQSLGDGLLDAALLARYEHTARNEDERSQTWLDGQLGKISACLNAIETLAPSLATTEPSIGDITIGCALGYLDFRFSSIDWRHEHPQAAQWFAAFETLAAMQATMPHEV